ncbi:ABC transporter ATP-binding protein [Glutamicibacter endophyticus]|uniref:ABC transporter ATP-binding protein n=1 Tax=Glutamicibacter endophyticus TaxID=1522174 RepID=UPI003AF09DD6
MSTLQAHALSKRFGRGRQARQVLTDVSLSIAPGERLGLIGRSGAGKTTLARILLGLLPPDAGSLEFDGQAVRATARSTLHWYRRAVQYIPQDAAASLSPRLTVASALAEPMKYLAVPGDRKLQARAALEAVQLPATVLERYPQELSGGQAQRVAIARALCTGAQLLLADEPVSGLDPELREAVLNLFIRLGAERGSGMLFITHDLHALERLCERTLVLDGGRIVEQGATSDILRNSTADFPRLLRASVPVPRSAVSR